MNNLFSHIEYLLLSHDCVIVPGLGAFIAIVNHASIDYGKGIIAPPSRSVMFNQAISSDDGLLANSYVRKFELSFEEARQIIIKEANLLKTTLNSQKELKAGNLGILKLGEEGNLVFTPAASVSEINSSLGFETIDLFGSRQNNHADTPTASEDVQSVYAEESVASQSTYYHLRIRKTLPKVAASLLFIVAFAIAVILYPIPSDNREQRASVVPVEAIMTPKIENHPIVNDSVKPQIKDDKVEIEKPLPSHYLIIATFSSNSEALKYIAGHSSEDLPMEAVESKKVTRVAIASSDDKDMLRKTLNSKDILSRYPNAWIWSRQ